MHGTSRAACSMLFASLALGCSSNPTMPNDGPVVSTILSAEPGRTAGYTVVVRLTNNTDSTVALSTCADPLRLAEGSEWVAISPVGPNGVCALGAAVIGSGRSMDMSYARLDLQPGDRIQFVTSLSAVPASSQRGLGWPNSAEVTVQP